jgi:hypothetical protein
MLTTGDLEYLELSLVLAVFVLLGGELDNLMTKYIKRAITPLVNKPATTPLAGDPTTNGILNHNQPTYTSITSTKRRYFPYLKSVILKRQLHNSSWIRVDTEERSGV